MTTPGQDIPPAQSGQAVPATQSNEEGGGIVQWLKDTYNGLYVIVLKPRMPEGILYAMGIIGLVLGLLWAYLIFPATFSGANPNRLNRESQEQWLLMTAVGTNAENLFSDESVLTLAQAIPNPRATIEEMLADPERSPADIQALQSLLAELPADIDSSPETAQAIQGSSLVRDFLTVILLPIVVMVILVVVITLLWRFLIYDNLVAPVVQRIAEMRDPELAAKSQRAREEIKIQQEQRRLREELAKQAGDAELGAPVMTQLAIYAPGRMFDESYEIELPSGEFLGQSGAVLAEAVDPDPIAIEVWLFDMFTSKNIAKIFVTPQGNADPSIRSKLEADVDNPATDIVVANPGASLKIDTDKLRLEARFANLEINPNGRFENFNLQMRAWNKDSMGASSAPPPSPIAAAGAPDMATYDDIQFDPPPTPPSGGQPDMSTYDNIQFDPPPTPPGSSAPDMATYDDIQFDPPPTPPTSSGFKPSPSSGGMTPLNPPPLSFGDDDEDDDPFGGTGDFTPLSGR